MLYYIVDSRTSDASFETLVGYVKTAYWPEEKYKQGKMVDLLPKWGPPAPPESQRLEEIKKALKLMVAEVCTDEEGLYAKTDGPNVDAKHPYMRLPFVDQFHDLFLRRQYDQPSRDPQRDMHDLLSLDAVPGRNDNYSKNNGNYYHFVNVVMAAARLIRYFSNPDKIASRLPIEPYPDARDVLCYPKSPSVRTFKLMLAAFYHDIGKAIVAHRHGMEGSLIIEDYTTRSLAQLDAIAREYGGEGRDHSLEREDVLQIGDLLYYHDSFGTLGTGESSYTLLAEIVGRIKRCSLRHIDDAEEQRRCCNRTLFDLWVLNIADIAVSNGDKFKLQGLWLHEATANAAIEEFFKTEGGKNRIHDFGIAMKLLQEYNKGRHSDDTSGLEKMAQGESRDHTVERIKRLVWSSLCSAAGDFEKRSGTSKVKEQVLDGILEINVGKPNVEPTMVLPPGVIDNVVFRAIQSLNDSNEFCKRLAWIVSMDYALGFFTKIASRAIEKVNEELDGGRVTGWIRVESASKRGPYPPLTAEQVFKANAGFFVDNYCATVAKILAHLLFRERSADQPSKIEFEDANSRLTPERIDKIIGLDGPYPQSRSIESILKSVFVY